ncbi:hypothetical protein [Butyrivibrio sp. AE3004]|uniref:hypothetical protein n=1 Tax=Butyrivibrio sp. AE3004 TaxID=1506994 RepID=UPI000493D0DD|nr:hypothetical protein [Butyrivibrio sp. AE3004]
MDRAMHNKTSLFLMELIIAIMFFSISGAICVQLFVRAHTLSEASIEMNNSVLWTQNISEVFYGYYGSLHEISDFFHDDSIILVSYEDNPEVGTLVMFFDEDFEIITFPTEEGALDDAKYELLLCISELPASEVYADTAADKSRMKGNALLGEITILKMENGEIIDQLPPKNDPRIISDRFVDFYIGTMEDPRYET